MKTLSNPQDADEIRGRLASLNGEEQRQWGSMSVGEAVCHVREAYRAVLAERAMTPTRKSPLPPRAMKYLGLRAPMKWPAGVPTVRELETGREGMLPAGLVDDIASTLAALDLFCVATHKMPHAIFGAMSHGDWMRWGYLHADHHLRQFGR